MSFRILFAPLVAAALSLGTMSATTAAPVNYDEGLGGDLDGSQLFALDFGTNTVTGSAFSLFVNESLSSDLDYFQFVVPTGGVLEGISLAFAVTEQLPDTISFLIEYMIQTASFPVSVVGITQEIDFLSDGSPVELFEGTLPLTAGPYYLLPSKQGTGGPGPGFEWGGHWSYTFTFEVAQVAVPEPGMLALFAAGLVSVAALNRRRRR